MSSSSSLPSSGITKTPKRTSTHRPTRSAQRTEVKINVYDLLPPGRLSSFLWTIGGSLLHSGVVINGREYAYGGHDKQGLTGVYWTRPKSEPPGGTFRCELLQGFSFLADNELDIIIQEASQKFQGTSYNLLTNNCNHFTSYLCQALTSRPAPSWLNRAASIGVALPCVVPKEWIAPPDHETAEGELLDEEDDESAAMLRRHRADVEHHAYDDISRHRGSIDRMESRNEGLDTSGRPMPPAERAPRR
ncbi:DUF862-domain-containing protein [Pseudovirgaria hyperparasitica]|uniref:DUF862-domain-containing protein n=1 Tax=Pseudovirgaria hyperparasitica TaxID=470096 RepID=A0A6A6WIM5_9PEZI|nr:DUF862-domain-containing protein [Pseudovirgaria hyperparasitica]KAF2761547.1 DUF862-domain-containing protein [Pseudovirgaria hyperparasitica]